MDCGVLAVKAVCRRWRSRSSASKLGYRSLSAAEFEEFVAEEWRVSNRGKNAVKVVVGKERRVFEVDPDVLEENPFQILLAMRRNGKKRENSEKILFVDCDAILFEHMLWLLYNDCSSLLQLNLEEIIEFYAQDST